MYSNEAKRANQDIYDDFQLKNPFQLETWVYTQLFHHFNPYSAGIDFSRPNLTSVDVRF